MLLPRTSRVLAIGGGTMSNELEAQFNVLVKYEEGQYLVEIVNQDGIMTMPLAEARDVSFHKAIEEAFSTLALNDQDYIEASL
jgi:histidinol phosphatase-like enzyme